MIKQAVGQDEVPHRTGQLGAGDLHVADGLALDLFLVDRQRHRHRPEILGLRQGVQRARLARIRQLITHFVAVLRIERACGLE